MNSKLSCLFLVKVWDREREVLQENCRRSEEMAVQLQGNVKTLQENLEVYSGKYQEFKTSISRSNQAFDDCKAEMSRMTQQIVTLEKEAKVWKVRYQKNTQTVLDLTTHKQEAERKVEQLQKLCRQLQVDRSAYLGLLKSNGIEPQSEAKEEKSANPVVEQKGEKEKELELLKGNLKLLQSQLTNLQLSEIEVDAECDTNNAASEG